MDAILSGDLGLAAMIKGEAAQLRWLDGRSKEVKASNLDKYFCGARDAIKLRETSVKTALSVLQDQWKKSSALTYTLLVLSDSTSKEIKEEIKVKLDHWYSDSSDILRYVRNVLFSKPLENFSIDDVSTEGLSGQLIVEVGAAQSKIRSIRQAWDEASQQLELELKNSYEIQMVVSGVFYDLSKCDRVDIAQAQFEFLNSTKMLQDNVRVSTLFFKLVSKIPDIQVSKYVAKKAPSVKPTKITTSPEVHEEVDAQSLGKRQSIQQKYKHVQSELLKIREHIRAGRIDQADKTLVWIAETQLKSGDEEYAAKTLCSASVYAKEESIFGKQLEYAEKAHQVAPDDSRVYYHLGDAYLNLEDFDRALEWFGACLPFSEQKEFGAIGQSKVYKRLGEVERSLSVLKGEGSETFASTEYFSQLAETYRSLHRFDEAILEYKRAFEEYPSESKFLCGRAATRVDARYFDLAEKDYRDAIKLFPNCSAAHTGLGHFLARMGQFDEAFPLLEKSISLSNYDPIAINALASAYRIKGQFAKAVAVITDKYSRRDQDFCYETIVEIVRNSILAGKYSEAENWLNIAERKFEESNYISLLRCRLIAARGNNCEALKKLDSVISKDEYFLEAYIEKSKILRKIGDVESAIKVVSQFLHEENLSVQLKTEAVLLGLIPVPEDAVENRAGKRILASFDDWSLDQAYGLTLIIDEKAESAWRISLDGKKRSPFKYLRKKFGIVLSLAKAALGQTGSIANASKGVSGPVGLMLKAYAAWLLEIESRKSSLLKTAKGYRLSSTEENLLLKCENLPAANSDSYESTSSIRASFLELAA